VGVNVPVPLDVQATEPKLLVYVPVFNSTGLGDEQTERLLPATSVASGIMLTVMVEIPGEAQAPLLVEVSVKTTVPVVLSLALSE
jgi:hypothetical protein